MRLAALLGAAVGLALIAAPARAACHAGSAQHGANCPGHEGGTHADPLPPLSGDPERPSSHAVAGHRDICAQVARWAPVHHGHRHDIRFNYYWVWAKELGEARNVQLVCSSEAELHGHSIGPYAHGISLPCPHGHHPLDVAWFTGEGRPSFWHAYGGFGHHNDGFWHYKLWKTTAGTTTVRLMGYCD